MNTITITSKDIVKAFPKVTINKKVYPDTRSASGSVIDELAYCAGQWTSEELWDNNCEYEPNEPYQYNYESDLFTNTKTSTQLYSLAKTLSIPLNANWERLAKEQKLQAGACVALNNEDEWNTLLEAYTEKLKEDRTDGISDAYNKELQSAIDSYNDDQYNEWLNGDHRNYSGVVYEIAKYFTEARDGSYNQKTDEYTFTLDEQDIENAKDGEYSKSQLKAWLLDSIIASGNDRARKDKQEREKRQEERTKEKQYKVLQAIREADERKAKLLSLTNK